MCCSSIIRLLNLHILILESDEKPGNCIKILRTKLYRISRINYQDLFNGCIPLSALTLGAPQGEKMRRATPSQTNRGKKKPISFGSVVLIKVERTDRRELGPHSVPGVVWKVTEHDNYCITCKGGVLKYCVAWGQFQIEMIKKAENYDVQDALLFLQREVWY